MARERRTCCGGRSRNRIARRLSQGLQGVSFPERDWNRFRAVSRARHSLEVCGRIEVRSGPPREAQHCVRASGRHSSLGSCRHSRGPGPAEREPFFLLYDEEVAAETLERSSPSWQKALAGKIDGSGLPTSWRRWTGAAATCCRAVGKSSSERFSRRWPEERAGGRELLEFDENSAAGCMTTDFVN